MKDEIFKLVEQERKRQTETVQLIPSENCASEAVRQAVGSVLMNKYAEGQVGKRYYQGMVVVDQVEALCKKRALKTFGLDEKKWGVNVQALSGSPANFAVYNALLVPGDKILAMALPEGGHLSHGWQFQGKKVTATSKFYQVDYYYTDSKTRLFDYEAIREQALKFKPKLIISGGTAYPREINHRAMGQIAKAVGGYYLADIAHEAGLVAAGVNRSPFRDAQVVTMTTHKTLRGPRGALIFARRDLKVGPAGESLAEAIDKSVFPGLQGGPHLHTIAGIAVCLAETQTRQFKRYSAQVIKNAQRLAKELRQYGFDVVSGGTDKHLVLIDLRNKQISGWILAWALEMAGIVVNRNTVPGETASPFYPSGVRLGSPAVTTRGMKEKEMEQIASWINQVAEEVKTEKLPVDKEERAKFVKSFLRRLESKRKLKEIRQAVRKLGDKYPVRV